MTNERRMLEKSADNYGMEISCDKSKILVNCIKSRPSSNSNIRITDAWKSVRRSGPVQISSILTNRRQNVSKGRKDQTGGSTLRHDKASNTVEKQSHQFSHKDCTQKVTCLVAAISQIHGSVMPVTMIRCRISYCRAP